MSDRVIFWASIWWPEESNSHGKALVSPSFGMEPDLVRWVREHRTDDCQVSAYKRTIRGADYVDERLSAQEEPVADPQRLRALMVELADLLEKKKRELDRGAKRKSAA